MEDWRDPLERGTPDAAWDLFIQRYRRLIFSAIRHYAQDYDDVMDIFARVCEALREDDLRRLRSYTERPSQAKFTTWLVAVIRNLTIDWFRHRDGRRRLSAIAEGLSPLGQRIVEQVFLSGRSHVEAFELICAQDPPGPSFRQFLAELRATYQSLGGTRRGRLVRELAPLPPSEPGRHDPDPIESPERRDWLDRALMRLDPEDRIAVQLSVIEELPAADIARMLGLPNAKAVYNKVYRALEAIRQDLGQSGIGPGDL